MNSFKSILFFSFIVFVHGSPMLQSGSKSNSFWSGTSMDGVVQQLHTECSDNNDAVSCMKYKVLNLLDHVFSRDSFQISDDLSVVKNSKPVESGRSMNAGVLEHIENYIESHDVIARLPGSVMEGTTLRVSPRNLENDEITFSLKFPTADKREGKAMEEARKSKLKKVIIPILVFVLLKAMTLIPLAIGVLGLKAWNALQLSFFSFVVSVALAIFQLCKKIAADASPGQVGAHGPWDNYQAAHYAAARSLTPSTASNDMAYSAYNRF